MNTTIDPEAPVIARGSIHIKGSPEAVWRTISDIPSWPHWNPDVTEAALHGSLAAGTAFTWKAGPGKIRSTLLEVDPPHRIAWVGKTIGIAAIHTWQIRPSDDGVELVTEESWKGLPARLFRNAMQKTLDRAIADGLDAAKRAVEGAAV
jgi:uncharacterized protein YndB with AHSA1/START domain